MHKKDDLISSKLGLDFYTAPSLVGGGGETNKAIGKKMDTELTSMEKMG